MDMNSFKHSFDIFVKLMIVWKGNQQVYGFASK